MVCYTNGLLVMYLQQSRHMSDEAHQIPIKHAASIPVVLRLLRNVVAPQLKHGLAD